MTLKRRNAEARGGRTVRRRTAGILLTAGILVLAACPAGADELSNVAGAFADIGIGARAMGMGGAGVASPRGPESIFWNPAGLDADGPSRGLSLAHCEQMGLVPYTAAAGFLRLGGTYTLGAAIITAGDDVLRETTGLLSVARPLPVPWSCGPSGASIGATVRTRWASYGNGGEEPDQVTGSALGFGLDVGVLVPISSRATIGLFGRDVAGTLEWDSSTSGSYDEAVPPALVAGVAVRPRDGVVVEIDLDKALHEDCNDVFLAGIETRLFGMADLRGGYRRSLADNEFEEYAIGAGVEIEAGTALVGIDLAYLFGRIENTVRFSLGLGRP